MKPQHLVILSGIAAVLITLAWLPIESVYHTGIPLQVSRYESFKGFWEIGANDSIRFQVLGVWWFAIALVTGGVWMVVKK